MGKKELPHTDHNLCSSPYRVRNCFLYTGRERKLKSNKLYRLNAGVFKNVQRAMIGISNLHDLGLFGFQQGVNFFGVQVC